MYLIFRNCKENGFWLDLNYCWNMYVCNIWNKEIFKIELVGLDYLEKKKIFKKGLNNLSCKKKMKFY